MNDLELTRKLSALCLECTGVAPMDLWKLFIEAIDEPEYPAANPSLAGMGMKVVPVSGGLDSTIAYKMACQEGQAHAIYMDFGQPYIQKELNALERLSIPFIREKYDIGYRGDMGKEWKHIIPARNLMILLRCAIEAGKGGEIYFGATKGEIPATGGDKSLSFIVGMRDYLQRMYGVSRIITLGDRTKSGWVSWWLEHGFERDYLLKTVSCFETTDLHCGACQSCLRHYIAFANNGYSRDEILSVYHQDPLKHSTQAIEKYRKAMRIELLGLTDEHYGNERCLETLSIIDPDWLIQHGFKLWKDWHGNN